MDFLSPPPLLPCAHRLCNALGLVARMAQALRVAVVVCPAFGQGLDVIALSGQLDTAGLPAVCAQWIALEQCGSTGLQLAPSHALGRVRLPGPGLALVVAAAAGAVSHQHSAAGLIAWLGCG